MNRILFFIVLQFLSLGCFAQGEKNFWYFGYKAGLDFNSGSPVALTDSAMSTDEGCATISDETGKLLFYTNGVKIWNKQHQVMPNGSGLKGGISSTQSAIIIPKPGSTSVYYVFTCAGEFDASYSEVDMTLDNGLGAVTSNKNIFLAKKVSEKLTATVNANGDGYWVLVHGFKNDLFYAFAVSASGVNTTPVISKLGAANTNEQSSMRFSPDGKKLVNCSTSPKIATEVLDFNAATGVLQNPVKLIRPANPQNLISNYSAEFSPSGNVLYLTDQRYIVQYDMQAADFPNFKTVINAVEKPTVPGTLQLGPDDKIYLVHSKQNYLAAINNPDVLGPGCDYVSNAVSLGEKINWLGLPQFIRRVSEIVAKEDCINNTMSFSLRGIKKDSPASWNFGDGSTSNELYPIHQYSKPGDYKVTVAVISNEGKNVTVVKTVTISSPPVIAKSIASQSVCYSQNMSYDLSQFDSALLGSQSAASFGVAYFSSLDDAQNHQNILPLKYNLPLGSSTVYAKVYNLANPACFATASFIINSTPYAEASIPNDSFVCDDSSNDGVAAFDLESQTSTIIGNQDPKLFSVTYHFSQNDANANIYALASNYQNESNPQTIYARVTNKQDANCYATATFQIGVNKMPIAHQPQDLFLCDESNDGKELFDFTDQTPAALGNQSETDFNVTYYLSQENAKSNSEPVADITAFSNSTNPQTIYVRLENKSEPSCFATTSFQLNVMSKPVLEMDDIYSICEGKSVKIVAPTGYSTYKWSTGATGNATMITKAGNYSLTVTKDYGAIACDVTKDIAVYNSNVATITKIETQDWTDRENAISIQTTGDGDYEYSIDGINYQDSPVFTDLPSGSYTVYVKDKKGCGVAMEEVYLLIYSKFFTPNADGYNDAWKIKFSFFEPELKVEIFDRYGKFLKQLSHADESWDGKCNEHDAPSDDYWFLVTRANGKVHKGHFSLIR